MEDCFEDDNEFQRPTLQEYESEDSLICPESWDQPFKLFEPSTKTAKHWLILVDKVSGESNNL